MSEVFQHGCSFIDSIPAHAPGVRDNNEAFVPEDSLSTTTTSARRHAPGVRDDNEAFVPEDSLSTTTTSDRRRSSSPSSNHPRADCNASLWPLLSFRDWYQNTCQSSPGSSASSANPNSSTFATDTTCTTTTRPARTTKASDEEMMTLHVLDVRSKSDFDSCRLECSRRCHVCSDGNNTIDFGFPDNRNINESNQNDNPINKSRQDLSQNPHLNVVNIPLGELMDRRYELPPRKRPFTILMNDAKDPAENLLLQECLLGKKNIRHIQSNLSSSTKNDSRATEMENTLSDERKKDERPVKRKRTQHMQQQKPWHILGLLDGSSRETWSQASELGLLHSSTAAYPPATSHKLSDQVELSLQGSQKAKQQSISRPTAQPRLWEPDLMVKDLLLPLILRKAFSISNFDCELETSNQIIEIWDLGSGSGRDVCFLAEELERQLPRNEKKQLFIPFQILAIDQRYDRACRGQKQHDSTQKLEQNQCLVVNGEARSTPSNKDAEECVKFWNRRGVGAHVQCVPVDLSCCRNPTEILELEKQTQQFQRGRQQHEEKEEDYYPSLDGAGGPRNGNVISSLVAPIHFQKILVVYAVRFWNRALVENFIAQRLPRLHPQQVNVESMEDSNSSYTKPQDFNQTITSIIFAISHFGKPSLQADWNFDHPKEKHVLQRNELKDIFHESSRASPSADHAPENGCSSTITRRKQWNIHNDRVVTDGDHGRTLIQFIAEFS